MKRFGDYLEGLCQSGSSYRWWYLSFLGGDLLEAYASMYDGGQGRSIVADCRDWTGCKQINRLATSTD